MQSEGFSNGLRLTVMNDYLKPEEACSKPPSFPVPKEKEEGMVIAYDGMPNEPEIQPVAKITLADCLACSGCVTSSEVIFLETQSTDEFTKQLQDKTKMVVVSVNQQSLSSIAVHFNLSLEQTFAKLRTYFLSIGVSEVFSLSCVRDVSLVEVANEFVERKKLFDQGDKSALPMLLGFCPGWVCYAEKTGDDNLLPHISTAKSSQQLMGNYLKTAYSQERKIFPSSIYHASVEPCYDKKLEAVRDTISKPQTESLEDKNSLSEVDIVLTTTEVISLLTQSNVDFPSLQETHKQGQNDSYFTRVSDQKYGSSIGYTDILLRHAVNVFWGKELEINQINFTKGRNNEIFEFEYKIDGKVVLTIARAYGFRNIQNVMRSIKRKNCKYDFVELLACPGGCSNGGGQIKAPTGTNPKELLEKVNNNYNSESIPILDPTKNPFVIDFYSKYLSQDTEIRRKQLHTSYKLLVPDTSSTLSSSKIAW